jgi:hypothetical protein
VVDSLLLPLLLFDPVDPTGLYAPSGSGASDFFFLLLRFLLFFALGTCTGAYVPWSAVGSVLYTSTGDFVTALARNRAIT